jgi:hypothetical protein
MFGFLKKFARRCLMHPRRAGLGDHAIILDRKFGSGRGTPIDRVLIKDFLQYHLPPIEADSRVLEFGDQIYSNLFLNEARKYRFEFQSGTTIQICEEKQLVVGDLLCSVPSNEMKFDLIVATQLLAFTKNPFTAADNLVSLLRPGGILIGTEPFNSPRSNYDDERWGDYFRFTQNGIQELFTSLNPIYFQSFALGNWETTYSLYKGFTIEDNLGISPFPDSMFATNIGYLFERGK